MSEAKHTPGPWEWDGDVSNYDPLNEAPWLVFDDVTPVLTGEIKCRNPADARLIAAAPELLETLKQMIAWEDGERTAVDAMANARAIVAKATGGAK